MKKLLYFCLPVALAVSCHKNNAAEQTPCTMAGVCTMEFRSVTVRFLNKQGNPLSVENFVSINTRTGKPLAYAGPTGAPGYYKVATDSNLKELSDAGDDILVSAKNPETGQTMSIAFKVAGGCACHVSKLSGPEQVSFTQ